MKASASPDTRADWLIAACALFLGCFALVTMIAAGYLNYTHVPQQDAWDLWNVRLSGKSAYQVLTTPHNGHVIPVARLIYLADEKLFRAQTASLLWLTFLTLFATAVVLYRLACSGREPLAVRVTVFGLVLCFVFSASQWINFTSSLQICFVLAFTAAIGSLGAFYKAGTATERRGWWFAGALVLALVSAGTSANGLIVLPLLILLALALGVRKVLLVPIVVILFGAVAFYRAYADAATRPLWDILDSIPIIVVYATAYLGSVSDEPVTALITSTGLKWEAPNRVALAAVLGALAIAWYIAITAKILTQRPGPRPRRITLFLVATFLLGSAALTGVGRFQYAVPTALTSRYTTPSVLFFICLILLTMLDDTSHDVPSRRSRRVAVAALVGGLFVGGLMQLPKVTYAFGTERFLSEGEYAIINDAFEPTVWERFFYAAGRMITGVRYLREHHLGPFTRPWTQWRGEPVANHFQIGPRATRCSGAWQNSVALSGSFIPSTVSEGWAYDTRTARGPDLLVFVDEGQRILGYATTTRRRPDVFQATPGLSNDTVGWVVYLRGGLPVTATAYAVLDDGVTLCEIGGRKIPGAFFTAPAARAAAPIDGVRAETSGTWESTLPSDAPAPPFQTATWSSQGASDQTAVLKLGPVEVSSGSVGLPIITGPQAIGVRVTAVDRRTNQTVAIADVPPGQGLWDLWRIDLPIVAPAMSVEYTIERKAATGRDWVAVGSPRVLTPVPRQ